MEYPKFIDKDSAKIHVLTKDLTKFKRLSPNKKNRKRIIKIRKGMK